MDYTVVFNIDGESFKSKADYEMALKDKAIIDELKAKYNVNTEAGIKNIYEELKTVQFKTSLGDKFDDFIFEQNEKIKNKTFENHIDEKSKVSKKQNAKSESARLHDINDPKVKKQVIAEIKKQNRRRDVLIVLLFIIALSSIGYYIKYYNDARKVEDTANEWSELKDSKYAEILHVEPVVKKDYDEEIVIPDILDEYVALFNKNKSLIGWIKIADTIIDYPVMQTNDNDYYLKYNFNQQKDANGAIFLDYRCDAILGNTNWILYGHHMNNGKMFSSLIKFANQDFFEKHRIIEFDTIYEKGTYEVMYAFRSRVYSSDEITFKYYQFIDANSAEEFDSAMEEMEKDSLIDSGVKASYGDKLLTLSTCDYQEENGRFVVVAKRID